MLSLALGTYKLSINGFIVVITLSASQILGRQAVCTLWLYDWTTTLAWDC